MAETSIVYVEVDWDAHDDDGSPYYRNCDFCDTTAADDAVAGKRIADFRTFHRIEGGSDDGLTVCGNCLDKYLAGGFDG